MVTGRLYCCINVIIDDTLRGCTSLIDSIINHPTQVGYATNKLEFFRYLSEHDDINLPDYTTSLDEAISWVPNGAVVARTRLTGHSGEGIVLMTEDNPGGFVRAPLYTRYIKKQDEFRVHVVNNEVIDVQRKALSSEAVREDVDWRIRNHAGGFIYAREGVDLPDVAKEQALRVIRRCGLDFGAVDLIYNRRQDKYYVLEVNTAPGLTGTTLTNYTNAMRGFI